MKAYRMSRGIAPLILNIHTTYRLVVKFTSRPFYHRQRALNTGNHNTVECVGTMADVDLPTKILKKKKKTKLK